MNSLRKRRFAGYQQKMKPKLSYKQILLYSSSFLLLLISGLVLYFNFSNVKVAYAVTTGDYRAKATGNWSTASTWERYNGSAWVAATLPPTSLDGVITIQSPYIVTITAGVLADQIIINSGGQLTLNSGVTLTLANGAGNDLDVSGIFKNSGTVTSTGAAIVFQSTGKYQHSFTAASGTIPTATWNSGSTCEIINTGSPSAPGGMAQTFSNFTWNCASQSADVTLSGAPTTVTGTYSVISTGTKRLRLASGNSTLTTANFVQSGGDLTLSTSDNATTTINISSNFSMTDGTFSFGSGKNGFCNMNITGSWLQSAGAINIEGEKWQSTIIINGNWSQTNGTFTGSNKQQTTTITVNGDWSQSGGTFTSIDQDQTCTFNIYGNYSHTGGTISEAGSGATSILFIFKDTGTQTFTASANTVTGVDFTVNSGSTLVMGNNILKGRNFTLSSGAELQMGSAAGITSSGATGNIQVTGTRSFNAGASYTYNGSIAQVTGNGLPATIANLTLNNSANLTLTNTVSVSNIITLTTGKIITGAAANELRSTNSAPSGITGYSSTDYIIGKLKRTVTGTGTYDFPLGTNSYYELASVTLSSATGFTTLLGSFTNSNPVAPGYPLSGILISGMSINQMLDYGYWTLTPNVAMTGGTYSVTLQEQGYTPPNARRIYCVLKRANVSSAWQSLGTHDVNTQSEIGGVVTAVRSGLTSFSDFGIGFGEYLQFFHPLLTSGTDGQPGAIYLFQDICNNVDAWVQILQLIHGATLDDIDHFTDGYDAAWQPFINAVPNDTSGIKWLITFKAANSSRDTILPAISFSAIDVDGDGSYLKEFVISNNIYSYSVDPATNLSVTRVAGGGYRAISPVANVANIDTAHHEAIFQINYRNVNNFTYTTGAVSTYSSVETRQNSLFFSYFFNGNVALPVELVSFTAKPEEKTVKINWKCAAELNNDYFTILRSADGREFKEIGRVKGAGNTSVSHEYSYDDNLPLSGNSYYRLKQTDYNGHSETFNLVPVSMTSDQNSAEDFRIFPNPFKDSFTVQFKSEQSGEVELQLLNYSGNKLFSKMVSADEGANSFQFTPTGNIVPGLYIFRVLKDKNVLADLKVLCKK